jgi:rhodanese-related sulfurtransferase
MEINEVSRISCEELKQLKDRGEDVVIIDTRRNDFYVAEHIDGAVNIYYDHSAYSVEREFMLSALPQDVLLVPYCD